MARPVPILPDDGYAILTASPRNAKRTSPAVAITPTGHLLSLDYLTDYLSLNLDTPII